MSDEVLIDEADAYGGRISINNVEIADLFEDYITETAYVLFEIKIEENCRVFFFGQASCVEKIQKLWNQFSKQQELSPQ